MVRATWLSGSATPAAPPGSCWCRRVVIRDRLITCWAAQLQTTLLTLGTTFARVLDAHSQGDKNARALLQKVRVLWAMANGEMAGCVLLITIIMIIARAGIPGFAHPSAEKNNFFSR